MGIQKEFKDVTTSPPEWLVSCNPVGDNLQNWRAKIQGPEDSPYAEGQFVIEVDFPNDYPFKPPKVRFVTKVYHPNVKSDGQICTESFPWAPQNKAVDFLLKSDNFCLSPPLTILWSLRSVPSTRTTP